MPGAPHSNNHNKKNTAMHIQFIQSPSGPPYNMAYHEGETADLPNNIAQELIDAGFAISTAPVEETPKPRTRKPRAQQATDPQAEKAETR
jgi:hypothetical protein